MFLSREPQDAASFTDETSRRNTEKTSRKVWTHAQVGKHISLAWFTEIYGMFPKSNGELKYAEIADGLDKLPRDVKLRLAVGIRPIRIHIVDTFAYEAEYKQFLRYFFKCDNYEKMLQQDENQELAKFLILEMEKSITESVLYDSPAQRLERNFERQRWGGFGYGLALPQNQFGKPLEFNIEPFKKGKKKSYDTAAKWVCKSNAVFSDATDFSGRGFLGEYEMRQRAGEMLDYSHAFDEGDDESIKWLEAQRNHFARRSRFNRFGRRSTLYGNVDSKYSMRIQAADIAAGIAQRTYDEYELQVVLDKFDYVTFNGKKINEENIKQHLAYWNNIVERENKIQKLINNL